MKSIQKIITIIIWCCSIAIVAFEKLSQFGSIVILATAVAVFSVSVISNILYFLKIPERIKAVAVLLMVGLGTLGVSIALGGNAGTFIASFVVLGMATLYFDPPTLLGYTMVYIPCCIAAYIVNPLYVAGGGSEPYMGVVMIFAYLIMALTLYLTTKIGSLYMKKARNDEADAQMHAEKIGELTKLAQQNATQLYENISASDELVKQLSQKAIEANENVELLNHSEASMIEIFNELNQGMTESTLAIEKNNELITKLDEDYTVALGNVKESKEFSKQAQKVMTELLETVRNAHECIKKSMDETRKINEIIQNINGITTETNLLAINASIEAARSGERGTGFNIVAQQVRDLSEQSSHAITNIDQIIGNLSETLGTTNDTVTDGVNAVLTGIANLERMVKCIETIDEYSQQSQDALRQEVSAFNQLKEEFSMMVSEVDKTKNTANQNLNDLDAVVKSIQTQSNGTTQVANNLKLMEEVAGRLTSQFQS